jgi:hypothetical protein
MHRLVMASTLLALVDCSNGPQFICTPGKSESCPCPGRPNGVQICQDDGQSFGECQCPSSAGGGTASSNGGGSADGSTGGDGAAQEFEPGEFISLPPFSAEVAVVRIVFPPGSALAALAGSGGANFSTVAIASGGKGLTIAPLVPDPEGRLYTGPLEMEVLDLAGAVLSSTRVILRLPRPARVEPGSVLAEFISEAHQAVLQRPGTIAVKTPAIQSLSNALALVTTIQRQGTASAGIARVREGSVNIRVSHSDLSTYDSYLNNMRRTAPAGTTPRWGCFSSPLNLLSCTMAAGLTVAVASLVGWVGVGAGVVGATVFLGAMGGHVVLSILASSATTASGAVDVNAGQSPPAPVSKVLADQTQARRVIDAFWDSAGTTIGELLKRLQSETPTSSPDGTCADVPTFSCRGSVVVGTSGCSGNTVDIVDCARTGEVCAIGVFGTLCRGVPMDGGADAGADGGRDAGSDAGMGGGPLTCPAGQVCQDASGSGQFACLENGGIPTTAPACGSGCPPGYTCWRNGNDLRCLADCNQNCGTCPPGTVCLTCNGTSTCAQAGSSCCGSSICGAGTTCMQCHDDLQCDWPPNFLSICGTFANPNLYGYNPPDAGGRCVPNGGTCCTGVTCPPVDGGRCTRYPWYYLPDGGIQPEQTLLVMPLGNFCETSPYRGACRVVFASTTFGSGTPCPSGEFCPEAWTRCMPDVIGSYTAPRIPRADGGFILTGGVNCGSGFVNGVLRIDRAATQRDGGLSYVFFYPPCTGSAVTTDGLSFSGSCPSWSTVSWTVSGTQVTGRVSNSSGSCNFSLTKGCWSTLDCGPGLYCLPRPGFPAPPASQGVCTQ